MVASNVHVSNLAYACKDKLDCRSQIKAFMVKCVYLLHDIITSMMQGILGASVSLHFTEVVM